MLVISNHVKTLGLPLPKDVIIRINIAWLQSLEQLENIILENSEHAVWVDYPTGRTKPPVPLLTLGEAISCLHKFKNVKYFAFSNAEDINIIQLIRQAVPNRIKLIPKIETSKGVSNLEKILLASETDMVMLDVEDLYSNCLNIPSELKKEIDIFNQKVKNFNIKVFKLGGVIFSDV